MKDNKNRRKALDAATFIAGPDADPDDVISAALLFEDWLNGEPRRPSAKPSDYAVGALAGRFYVGAATPTTAVPTAELAAVRAKMGAQPGQDLDQALQDFQARELQRWVDEWQEQRPGDRAQMLDSLARHVNTVGHLGLARWLAAVASAELAGKPWPLPEKNQAVSAAEVTEARARLLRQLAAFASHRSEVSVWLTRVAQTLEAHEPWPVLAAEPDVSELEEARSWARHGYEIAQRSNTWSDHGVAPKWLTENYDPATVLKAEQAQHRLEESWVLHHDDPAKAANPERYEIREVPHGDSAQREVLLCLECERSGLAHRGSNIIDVARHDAYHDEQAPEGATSSE